MLACHSLHTHIHCLIEHSLKEQLLNILFSSPLQCVALGLMCCSIQTLLWKQIFSISISAACCSSTRVLPDFERVCFHNACISHVCGRWRCAARLRPGLLHGFSHLGACFPAMVLSLAPQPAQQRCKTDPRNVHSAQPEVEKFKSVCEKGRNSMQFFWVLFSMKIGLRLHCLKLNLSCLLPTSSVLFVADLCAADEAKLLHSALIHCRFRSWGKVVYHHRTKDNIHYVGRGNLRSSISLDLRNEPYNLMFFTTDVFKH